MDFDQDKHGANSAIAIALHHLPHLRSLRLPRCKINDLSLLPPATQLTSFTLLL
jgi:hypothetical protein